MTFADVDLKDTLWLTNNNNSAAEFLYLWRAYVHGIDDLIDGDATGPEAMLSTFMQAAFVYTHPFFLANLPALRQIAINCTNAYADSVAWEKSDVDWKRNFADHYRHFGAEMVIAVATLCGGYKHARNVSLSLREICWTEHHDEKGQAV